MTDRMPPIMYLGLIILYYTLAWGVCGGALLLSFIKWRQQASTIQGWFTLILAGFAIFAFAGTVVPNLGLAMPWLVYINFLSLATFPLFTLALPMFISSFASHPHQGRILRAFRIAVIFTCLVPFIAFLPRESLLATMLLVLASTCLALWGLYTVWRLRILSIAYRKGQLKVPSPWGRVLNSYFYIGILLFPLVLLVDLLQLFYRLFGWQFPSIMPLFGSIVGGVWLFHLLKDSVLLPAQRRSELPPIQSNTSEALQVDLGGFGFSPREQEVALLLIEGLSYQEIAAKLFISAGTVKTHVLKLYQKTDTNSKMAFLHAVRQNPPMTPLE